ncbi:hypothetical protein OG252_49070 [Streptomyces sp. NBC_01352]|uniref:hypothetical protein n=1 Tax=unclassified Streptomyces TaxID=2593676 RepID=UPI002E30E90C|nr:hypothetical protein [Streptomyces sp. NBC_01352]
MLEQPAPGHVEMVRDLLIDVLMPDQVRALADVLGEVSRRMAAGTGEYRAAADETACSGAGAGADVGAEAAADLRA